METDGVGRPAQETHTEVEDAPKRDGSYSGVWRYDRFALNRQGLTAHLLAEGFTEATRLSSGWTRVGTLCARLMWLA